MSVADRFNAIVDQLIAKLYANFPLPESGREVVRDIVQKDTTNRYNNLILTRLSNEMWRWQTRQEEIDHKSMPETRGMSIEEAAIEAFKRMLGGYSIVEKRHFASAEELLEYHKEEAKKELLSYCDRRVEEPVFEVDHEWKDFFIMAMRAIYQPEP